MYTGYPSNNLVPPFETQRVWTDVQFSVCTGVLYGANCKRSNIHIGWLWRECGHQSWPLGHFFPARTLTVNSHSLSIAYYGLIFFHCAICWRHGRGGHAWGHDLLMSPHSADHGEYGDTPFDHKDTSKWPPRSQILAYGACVLALCAMAKKEKGGRGWLVESMVSSCAADLELVRGHLIFLGRGASKLRYLQKPRKQRWVDREDGFSQAWQHPFRYIRLHICLHGHKRPTWSASKVRNQNLGQGIWLILEVDFSSQSSMYMIANLGTGFLFITSTYDFGYITFSAKCRTIGDIGFLNPVKNLVDFYFSRLRFGLRHILICSTVRRLVPTAQLQQYWGS